MAIDERNGRFRAQVMIDGKRFNGPHTFETKQQAADWIEDQKRKGRRDEVIQMPSKDTLASVIDDYIAKEGNWSADKTNHLLVLKRDLGKLPLSKLTKPTIYDYISDMETSRGRRAARLSFLKSALDHAEISMHLVPRLGELEVARKGLAKKKIIGRSKARTRQTTAAEIKLVAEHHNSEDDRALDLPAILEILSLLPIRVGELCVSDEDERRGVLWCSFR